MEETDSTTTTATMGGGDDGDTQLPLMKISYTTTTRNGNNDNDDDLDGTRIIDLECECLLVAVGRVANVDSLGLDDANVEYDPINGILVDEYSKSITNPNVYAVGDCVAYVPRLTHGEGRALMSTSPPKKQIHYIYRSSRDIVLKVVLTLSSFSHAIFKRIIVPD